MVQKTKDKSARQNNWKHLATFQIFKKVLKEKKFETELTSKGPSCTIIFFKTFTHVR